MTNASGTPAIDLDARPGGAGAAMTAHVKHPYHAKLKRVLARAGDLYTLQRPFWTLSIAARCSRGSRASRGP